MIRQVYLVSTSSLLIGFLTGVFVYFQSGRVVAVGQTASVVESGIAVPKEAVAGVTADVSGFEIIGSIYGGCERTGCSSYRIRSDGTYTYLSYTNEMAMVRFDDVLTESRRAALERLLEETDYEVVLHTPFGAECPTVYDGLGYRYEVRAETTRYRFDSCRQELATFALFTLLKDQFEIFRVTHRSLE